MNGPTDRQGETSIPHFNFVEGKGITISELLNCQLQSLSAFSNEVHKTVMQYSLQLTNEIGKLLDSGE